MNREMVITASQIGTTGSPFGKNKSSNHLSHKNMNCRLSEEELWAHTKLFELLDEMIGTLGFNIAGFMQAPSFILSKRTAKKCRRQTVWVGGSGRQGEGGCSTWELWPPGRRRPHGPGPLSRGWHEECCCPLLQLLCAISCFTFLPPPCPCRLRGHIARGQPCCLVTVSPGPKPWTVTSCN